MDKLELHGHTDENGIFHIQNRNRLIEWARMHPNKKLLIRIDKRGSKRSDPQNRYYWGIVVETIRHGFLNIGYELSKDETHYFLKEKFNPVTIENKQGVTIEMPGSTTTLTKSGFAEYVEKIARFGAEYLGVVVPQPNEHLEMKFD